MVMSLQVRMPGVVPPPPLSGVALDRPMKVIAVDEDQQFRRMLSDELAEYGFDVTTFSDGAALLEAASVALAADLIILDWSLRSSAIDLLSRLREAGVDVPVVFVTGRPLMANEDRAFALGARDFIDKSRGMGILVRRLRLAVRNSAPERRCDATLERGHLTLMPNASRAFWKGDDIGLTVGEFKVLQFIVVESRGRAASYREIYDRMHYRGFVAGYGDDGYRVNVRSMIRRIRVKFRLLDPTFDAIRNDAALGYAWATEPCAPQPA